ncbi:MAG TPA: murein L,D-transpeptidase catalytic domain family protein [Chitinophagaceae bacterium]|nr:murein L,D-transpeptidase catalytic domain family protein [Chitinophagaceae bacterium]
MHPYTPVSFRNKIDVARLARKMSRTISTRHLQLAPVTVNTPAEETVAVAETAVNQAVAMASVEEQQKTTGGSAYHSTAKETKSPTDISSFSAIRQPDKGADSYSYATIYNGTEALRDLAVRNGNNTDYAIMVNLGIKTGKKRFFLVDLTSNTIIKSGIVAEGSGDMTAVAEKKYSNDLGSTSTALGVYSIGKRTSKDAYRLQGLQETNSNAAKRGMLLQATEDVPSDEIAFPLIKTSGSLSLSPGFFKEISAVLNASTKPVLLWVYDPTAEAQSAVAQK